MVSIDKVVKVHLDTSSTIVTAGQYNTVAYLVDSELTALTNVFGKVLTSESDYIQYKGGSTPVKGVDAGVNMFFTNGGNRLVIYPLKKPGLEGEETALSQLELAFSTILSDCEKNNINLIYVVLSTCVSEEFYTTDSITSAVSYLNKLSAPNTKRLVITSNNKENIQQLSDINVCAFYTNLLAGGSAEDPLLDTGLLIGAYTSGINLNGSNTIRDFCYTPAAIKGYVSSQGEYVESTYDEISTSDYDDLIQYSNFISKIGNKVLVFGGNLTNGVGIDTDFGCICIENDIAETLVDIMINKQYLTALGLTNVIGKIESLLTRYQTNGYVQYDSNYTDSTIVRTYNGRQFTIITQQTALPKGYLVTAVPIQYITQEDKQLRKFTPIYVILQTQKGARVVEVSGTIQ